MDARCLRRQKTQPNTCSALHPALHPYLTAAKTNTVHAVTPSLIKCSTLCACVWTYCAQLWRHDDSKINVQVFQLEKCGTLTTAGICTQSCLFDAQCINVMGGSSQMYVVLLSKELLILPLMTSMLSDQRRIRGSVSCLGIEPPTLL